MTGVPVSVLFHTIRSSFCSSAWSDAEGIEVKGLAGAALVEDLYCALWALAVVLVTLAYGVPIANLLNPTTSNEDCRLFGSN